jgi:2-polyprenyl-6-hydroxyphenyl methylase / 3-demethylubiquinone-9 3-methyltransferase
MQTTPSNNPPAVSSATLDRDEVDRFNALARQWWDPHGNFRPLHKIGPARIGFIRDTIVAGLKPPELKPPELKTGASRGLRVLDGLRILDIGCGGGLVAEPLARLGARMTGIDPAPDTIAAAQAHAQGQGLAIDYRATRAEALVAAGETFDVVLCLEVVEHVPDVAAFLAVAAGLVRPGGVLILSTINRTLKSYALAIIGAEYVLRWLPVGTHRWDKFIKPDELAGHVRNLGLTPLGPKGIVFNPFEDTWTLADDTDVNYMLAARSRL